MVDNEDQKILDYLNKIEDQKALDYILNFSWFSVVVLVVFLAIGLIRTVF